MTTLLPLGFVTFLLLHRAIDRTTSLLLVREDGPYEYLTFLAYIIVAGLALAVGAALGRAGERLSALAFFGLGAAAFVVAGEEISWGQRIFMIQSPEFFAQYNRQQEINAHNFLHRYILHAFFILISGYAALGWLTVPRLLGRLPQAARRYLAPRQWMFVPDRRLMLYFIPCLLLYVYYDYVNPFQVLLYGPEWHINKGNENLFFIVSRDQEAIELLLSCGVVLFVALVLRQARRLRGAS